MRPAEVRDQDRSQQRTGPGSGWRIGERIECLKVSARFLTSVCVLSVIFDHLEELDPALPSPQHAPRPRKPLGSPTSR